MEMDEQDQVAKSNGSARLLEFSMVMMSHIDVLERFG